MNYEQTKREAAETVDKWFVDNGDHWRTKAREVADQCNAYEKDQSKGETCNH